MVIINAKTFTGRSYKLLYVGCEMGHLFNKERLGVAVGLLSNYVNT